MDYTLNGMGRIGRALFRISFYDGCNICTHINEPYASVDDIIYFLKYDSLYANFMAKILKIDETSFSVEDADKKWLVSVSHHKDASAIKANAPIIVDASGEISNLDHYNRSDKKLIFTASSPMLDHEVILGLNDSELSRVKAGDVISSSICDSVAVAPILGKLASKHSLLKALITTMHPALTYQKVLDNYMPIGINRSLGRQYIDSIIPKRTSLEPVLKRHLGKHNTLIRCMSFRVPTESVCSADFTLLFEDKITRESIINELESIGSKIVGFSSDDLVSIDYKATAVSATVDLRWLEVLDDHILKMIIWYDNEWGYSSRINDLISMI